MRVLVTGGAGFIGSALCARLAPDHQLLVVDNLSTGSVSSLPAGTELVQLDLGTADGAVLERHVAEFGPEAVVHLAAIHYIPYCMSHPDETFLANVRATHLLCRVLGPSCRKIVFTSTADVYPVTNRRHRETDVPEPRNVYGHSKWMSEQIVAYTVAVGSGLAGVSVRLANVYGPGETNPHVIPDVIDRLRDPGPPELAMGFLGSERDFVHVTDVAEAIRTLLVADVEGSATYNVGSGTNTPVRRVVDILQGLCGDRRPIREEAARLRPFDRQTLRVDTARIRADTPWRPRVELEAGLADLVDDLTTYRAAVAEP